MALHFQAPHEVRTKISFFKKKNLRQETRRPKCRDSAPQICFANRKCATHSSHCSLLLLLFCLFVCLFVVTEQNGRMRSALDLHMAPSACPTITKYDRNHSRCCFFPRLHSLDSSATQQQACADLQSRNKRRANPASKNTLHRRARPQFYDANSQTKKKRTRMARCFSKISPASSRPMTFRISGFNEIDANNSTFGLPSRLHRSASRNQFRRLCIVTVNVKTLLSRIL